MNSLVKLIKNDDGDMTHDDEWHLIHDAGGSPTTLCTSEVFGEGEGEAVYETKSVKRGGITCRKCIQIIKDIKAIKL